MKSCFVKTFSQYIRLDNDQAACLTLARSPHLSLSIAVLIKRRIFSKCCVTEALVYIIDLVICAAVGQ